MGPMLIGQLEGDDPIYLGRDSIEKNSQGMQLTIADSDGTFWLTQPQNSSSSAH
jgi:hypothetical protein